MFSKVSAQNFMCFKDFEVNLKGQGLVQIVGESEDRFFTSNGVGKTSLSEAIFFCLFGTTTKGISGDSVVNKVIDKDCIATVEFDDGLIVERYRKHSQFGNNLILRKGQKEFQKKTIKETEAVLYERLNISQEIFQILSYISQEGASFFIDSTDANQKDLFDKILNLIKFEIGRSKVDLDIKNIDILLNESKYVVKDLNTRLKAYIENLDVLEKNKEAYEEIQKQKHWELKGEKDKINVALKPLYSELEKLQFNLSNLEYDENNDDKVEKKKEEVEKIKTKLLSAEREEIKLEGEQRKYIDKIKVINAGECPTCGSVFEANKEELINSFEELLIPIKAELADNNLSQTEMKKELAGLNEEVVKLEKQARESFRNQEKLKNDVKLKQKEIDNLTSRLKDLESRINEKDLTIPNLEKDIEKIQKDLVKLADEVDEEEKKEKKYIEDRKILSFWEKSFGKKGIRSFILDNIIDVFNQQINFYLSEIGYTNIEVLFSNKAILKSGEEREKISFNISIDGIEYDYQSLSGGEKTRLNLSVLFALRDLVTTNKSNVLILDETFSFLDLSGCEAVISLLKNKLAEEGGLNSIFLVNHNSLLDPLVPDKLTVRREGQFSNVIH
ncbi:hypothetical protein M0R19_05900 [Candidatus Pacearchaeota archaeon]|jgi:DNA repair exonuclease SbcCD ATPase subunit|nr:hypothetical protein [Candidatus Pacearchaeota archaeon]